MDSEPTPAPSSPLPPPSGPPATAPLPPPTGPPASTPHPAGGPPSGGGGSRRYLFIGLGVFAVVVLLIGVVALIGGDEGDGGDQAAGPSSTEPGTWTVLVYQMADNNLEFPALIDLEEMAAAGTNENLSLVVMSDRSAESDPAAGYSDDPVLNVDDWVGAKTFEVGNGELTEIDDHGEINMDDPAVLADFVATGFEQYPADNYSVVLWDHGGGWVGMGPDESAGSVEGLTVPAIGSGLTDGIERAGVDQLDMVGFDACLMATYEVGQAMAPVADFMVASQELEPGHGWDWRSLGAAADGETDAIELGRSLLVGYEDQAEAEQQEGATEITLSLVDLGQLGGIADNLEAIAGDVADDTDNTAAVLGQQRAQNLAFGSSPDPDQDFNLTDLGQLTDGLADADGESAEAAREAGTALDAAVIDQVTGPATEGASGLSVYFPPSREDLAGDDSGAYEEVGDRSWAPVLDAYYDAGESIPDDEIVTFDDSAPSSPEATADYAFDENGVTIAGTFADGTAENLSEAFVSYGVPTEDGSIVYFGDEPGTIYDDGTADAVFDLTTLVVSDGQDDLDAYLELGYDEENDTVSIDVPFAYYPPGETESSQDLILSIVVDADSNILSERYYAIEEGGTLSEFTADPAGLIFPLLLVELPDGTLEWTDYSEVGLFADIPSLTYEFVPLESGEQIYVDLTVVDYGGNADLVSFVDQVP